MFLHKIFVKNTLRTIEPKNHQKIRTASLRSDFTGFYKEKRVLLQMNI